VLAAMFVAGFLLVVQPVLDAFADQDAEIAQSKLLLAAYESRIASQPLVEERLAELKLREASATGVIAGNSAELAAANLQSIVKTLVENEGGQVRSAQNLEPLRANGFERIDVQYTVSVPMTRLKDTTYKLETNVPYLFLDGIDMHAPEGWQSEGAPYDPPNLEIRWTVRAYRWVGTP
jgi:general secretion pathway protein M